MTPEKNCDWLVSVDDHLFEPPTLWTDRLPAKYKDIGPRIEKFNGVDTWVYEDTRVPMTGISAVVGHSKDDWSVAPVNYADLPLACYEPKARVEAMDVAGILAQTIFPQYPRFCGQIFTEAKDKELSLLCVQAWNDYIIDEWGGSAPGRFIPIGMLPLWDAKLAAKEAARVFDKGARGLIFSENAADLGLPSIHDANGYWHPLFDVVNDANLPICMHIGSSSKLPQTAPDAPTALTFALTPLNAVKTLVDWMLSGQFFRYENLKIVLSEGEIGWIPFVLMWLDHVADTQRWASTRDFNFDMKTGNFEEKEIVNRVFDLDCLPSQLFRDHAFGCFIDDPVGVRNIDLIGFDNVMIESDFPHSDGSWPDSITLAKQQLSSLGTDAMYKVLVENACRVFQFTPADASNLVRRPVEGVLTKASAS